MSTVANWPTFMTRLIECHEVAEQTVAFQFEKPAEWAFKAGQFVDITLVNPTETDAEGNTRGFSISSAPHEPTIMVTARLRDTAFKRVLKNMPLNSEVKVEGPFGNLTPRNNAARPAVFLAGGIGITPFRSIVVHAAKEKLPHKILEIDKSPTRKGEVGLIDYQMLVRHLKAAASPESYSAGPIYYIAGPPQMDRDLQAMLTNAGVDSDDIRIEEFSGY